MKLHPRHAGLLLFVSLALLQPRPVPAEPTTDTQHAIQALYVYGSCAVDSSPSRARRVLSLVPGSKEERAVLRSLADDWCLNGHGGSQYLYFEPQMLRGAIAEALLRVDSKRGSQRDVAKEPPPFAALSAADVAGLSSDGRATLLALDIAQCLMSSDPQDVASLLATDPTSSEESRTFAKLTPSLGPCIPNGREVTLAKLQLRGVLAEAAYRSAFAVARSPQKPTQ